MANEIENVERLMRKFSRMTPSVRKATGQRVFFEAEAMASEMIAIAPRDDDPNNGEQIRDRIYAEDGRLGDVSMVVIADAKDARGRPKAPPVELGHKDAKSGKIVPAEPFFWPVVRLRRKGAARRIKSAMSRAVKKEVKGK